MRDSKFFSLTVVPKEEGDKFIYAWFIYPFPGQNTVIVNLKVFSVLTPVYSFGLPECNRVNVCHHQGQHKVSN